MPGPANNTLSHIFLDDKKIYEKKGRVKDEEYLFQHFSIGKFKFTSEANNFDFAGDVLMTSNLVVNKNIYAENMLLSRLFPTGDYTISYGMRINDNEELELFKHDSRENKSTPVYKFGSGNINNSSEAVVSESQTTDYTNIVQKSENLNLYNSSIF
jgi:hypothetical protein